MLSSHFIRRGYPQHLVNKALLKAEVQDYNSLIAKNAPVLETLNLKIKINNTFYLVSTHNPSNPPIREIIETNWALLEKSKTTRKLRDATLIFGRRRNKNLSDQLVRASTKTLDRTEKNIDRNPCNRSKSCRYCPVLNRTGTLLSTTTGRKYQSMQNVNCQSSKLIDVITCNKCKIQYVGQTKNRILTRFQGHITDITQDNDTTVAPHLNRCLTESVPLTKSFSIHIAAFITIPPDTPEARRKRDDEERRWMHRLNTITPYGLNLMD